MYTYIAGLDWDKLFPEIKKTVFIKSVKIIQLLRVLIHILIFLQCNFKKTDDVHKCTCLSYI